MCAAGRRGFIICDVAADSPAQSWDCTHHRHLLVPLLSALLQNHGSSYPDLRQFTVPITHSLSPYSSRKLRPPCRHSEPGRPAITASSQGTSEQKNKSALPRDRTGGPELPPFLPASSLPFIHHPPRLTWPKTTRSQSSLQGPSGPPQATLSLVSA